MEIKKMKDEIEIDMERRSHVFIPKYAPVKDRNDYNLKSNNPSNNTNIMRTI